MANRVLRGKIVSEYGTQSEACRAMGISEKRLSRLLHGYVRPHTFELAIFSAKLGPDTIEMLLKKDVMSGSPNKGKCKAWAAERMRHYFVRMDFR